jgi:hypothetical protein
MALQSITSEKVGQTLWSLSTPFEVCHLVNNQMFTRMPALDYSSETLGCYHPGVSHLRTDVLATGATWLPFR